jgi:flagellar biogenesis protein FliO
MNRQTRAFWAVAVLVALVIGIAMPSALAQESNAPDAAQKSYLDESEEVESDSPSEPYVPKFGEAMGRLIGVMVLLFALLVGGLVLFQKFSRRGLTLGGESRPLRVMDRVSLGPRSSVCLVQTCGKALVLGVSEKEITVLMDMDLAPQSGQEAGFAGTMQQVSDSSTTDSGPSPA